MTNKPEDDQKFFQQAMLNVKPLNIKKKNTWKTQPTAKKITHTSKIEHENTIDPIIFSDFQSLPTVSNDDLISFSKLTNNAKKSRKLLKRKYNVQATLDLHGYNRDEARSKVGYFLVESQNNGVQHVQIIHGRGNKEPILKNCLNNWLRQTTIVLKFESINPGALYVLLRRKKF